MAPTITSGPLDTIGPTRHHWAHSTARIIGPTQYHRAMATTVMPGPLDTIRPTPLPGFLGPHNTIEPWPQPWHRAHSAPLGPLHYQDFWAHTIPLSHGHNPDAGPTRHHRLKFTTTVLGLTRYYRAKAPSATSGPLNTVGPALLLESLGPPDTIEPWPQLERWGHPIPSAQLHDHHSWAPSKPSAQLQCHHSGPTRFHRAVAPSAMPGLLEAVGLTVLPPFTGPPDHFEPRPHLRRWACLTPPVQLHSSGPPDIIGPPATHHAQVGPARTHQPIAPFAMPGPLNAIGSMAIPLFPLHRACLTRLAHLARPQIRPHHLSRAHTHPPSVGPSIFYAGTSYPGLSIPLGP
jgi:hypothetical protein